MCLNHGVMILVSFEVCKVSLWQSGDIIQATWALLDSRRRPVEIPQSLSNDI